MVALQDHPRVHVQHFHFPRTGKHQDNVQKRMIHDPHRFSVHIQVAILFQPLVISTVGHCRPLNISLRSPLRRWNEKTPLFFLALPHHSHALVSLKARNSSHFLFEIENLHCRRILFLISFRRSSPSVFVTWKYRKRKKTNQKLVTNTGGCEIRTRNPSPADEEFSFARARRQTDVFFFDIRHSSFPRRKI